MSDNLGVAHAFTVHLTKAKIRTWARNADVAIDLVLKAELAPFAAFKAVYQDDPVPNVNAKYGAPMGRMSGSLDFDSTETWKATEVEIDEGGYDNGGAYWGLRPSGSSLFAVQDGVGNIAFVDAANTNDALAVAAA